MRSRRFDELRMNCHFLSGRLSFGHFQFYTYDLRTWYYTFILYISTTWPFRSGIKVAISFCAEGAPNADQLFKCDFNDLFTQILLQFIAKEVREICAHLCCQKVWIKTICLKCYSKLYAHCPILKSASGSYFGAITKQEIVFFSERAKADGGKISVYTKILNFSEEKRISTLVFF